MNDTTNKHEESRESSQTLNTEENRIRNLGILDAKLLASCIHCGLCLPACPTYLATGKESESPRGRIYLLSKLSQGKLSSNPRLVEHIESCLGCMGCQSACPSGVNYESIFNQAKYLLAPKKDKRLRRLMRLVFSKILPDYKRLHWLGNILRLIQENKLNSLLPNIPLPARWKRRLSQWEELLPAIPRFSPLPKKSWQSGKKAGEVELFSGCVMDIFYNHVNHAAIRLLTKQRQIVSLSNQTCCGALAMHAGELDITKDLAKKNIAFFEKNDFPIIVTSAGCSAMLKEYGGLFADDPLWHNRAINFSKRIKDITEALAEGEFSQNPLPLNKKVTYHAACHLSHIQNIHQEPIKLLNLIEGLTIIPLEEAEHCCGSAGIYNLLHSELSLKILDRKLNYLKNTGAEIVVTSNPGCLLQLESGIKKEKLAMRACHIVELLDEAFS